MATIKNKEKLLEMQEYGLLNKLNKSFITNSASTALGHKSLEYILNPSLNSIPENSWTVLALKEEMKLSVQSNPISIKEFDVFNTDLSNCKAEVINKIWAIAKHVEKQLTLNNCSISVKNLQRLVHAFAHVPEIDFYKVKITGNMEHFKLSQGKKYSFEKIYVDNKNEQKLS